MMPAFEELRACREAICIAHHIRGRIRLKAGALPARLHGPWWRQTDHYRAVLARTPGLHGVRLNPMARSCSVEYDPGVIPVEAWGDFLAGVESPAAAVLEGILRGLYREVCHAPS